MSEEFDFPYAEEFRSDFTGSGGVDQTDRSTNITDETIEEMRSLAARYPEPRSALLPILHLVQSVDGRVSPAGIEAAAEVLGITEAQVSGAATFYTMYKRRPAGQHHIGVCTTALCAIMGGDILMDRVEKKLGVVLGGYLNRSKEFGVKLGTAYNAFVDESVDKSSFERLKAREDAAGPARVAALREDTERLQQKERSLQSLYAELEREKNEAEQRVAILEERLMMEAEALNEAAMQQESS